MRRPFDRARGKLASMQTHADEQSHARCTNSYHDKEVNLKSDLYRHLKKKGITNHMHGKGGEWDTFM